MADTTDTTDTTTPNEIVFVKQRAGAEDLMFGFGTTAQIRGGENITLQMINAATIPYDNTRSVKAALDELFANVTVTV